MQILRDEGYIDVRIPFEDRIEWLDTSNRRNPSIFMDLVIAHTAMNRYQRALLALSHLAETSFTPILTLSKLRPILIHQAERRRP
jgi:hypothetical protein